MPAMENRFAGGCLCGAVRYVLTAAPNYVYFCHCLDCQRESGSPFVTDMNIDAATLQIAGPLTRYTRTGDSGKSIHRNFCTLCGTTLLTEFDVDPEHVSIKACSLDDPSWLEPDRHLFTSRMQPWLKLNDGLMQYERDC
jgi:hypothetical protein